MIPFPAVVALIVAITTTGLWWYFDPDNPISGPSIKILAGMCAGAFAFLITQTVMWTHSSNVENPPWKENVTEHELYSMFNERDVSGSFFLGIGGFSTNRDYYYYLKEEKGYRRHSVNGDAWNKVYIREDSTQTPTLRIIEYYEDDYWFESTDRPKTEYIFIVPQGTIFQEYEAK